MVIGKHLFVGSHPIAKAEEEERGEVHLSQDCLAEPLVVHRRQPVAIVQHRLLYEIEDHDGRGTDREQDRDAEAVCERHEDSLQQLCILEVHHVDRAGVNVDVGLEAGLLGRVLVECEAAVKGPP